MSDGLQSTTQQGVQLVDIRLQRGQTQVFDGLNLALTQKRIGVIGNNGAGKSSLFRLLCGLELPQAGQVLVDGMPLLQARQHKPGLIGLMFQNPDDQIIFPTVEEELALGLRPQGLSKQQARARARELLAERGLAHWAERAVSSLSQGQRQQVCWLSLLIAAPQLLLLDEPFASLDLPGQALLAQDIATAPQQVLVSTHVLDHVRDFERVIWLEQGRLRGDGPGRDICSAYETSVRDQLQKKSSHGDLHG
ncbi:ABC transporter [Comamonas testosteroni]|uniref:ABC transporter n=1 Tax=Comamonas testosteroni TaxID=285 RepID=A0A0L7MQV3_COMTE|nr:ABC transporter ATP-binding protein [Comamonas testosteroni]KOC24316.1 ABC transporter [Comamonas testosteroni]KWT67897.1 ATPase component BioM of energizing module of biotin ECF transporter [Comamonas testosteroni]